MEDENYEKALSYFQEAILVDPTSALAYMWLAYAFEDLGRLTEARNSLTRALVAVPEAPEVWSLRASLNWVLGDLTAAEKDAEEAKRIDPEYEFAYNTNALIQVSLGDLSEALNEINRAILLTDDETDLAYFKDTRGFIYLKQGDYKRAMNQYLSIEAFDEFTLPYYDLGIGIGYANLNNQEKAREHINKGIDASANWALNDPQLIELIAMAQESLRSFSTPLPAFAIINTLTSTATRTPRPTLTSTRIPTRTPTATRTPVSSFGPVTRELEHDPVSNQILQYRAFINVADMVVDAIYINPYSSSDGDWDYGFMFRRSALGDFNVVTVNSKGRWNHWVRQDGDSETDEDLESGFVSLDKSTRGSNTLKLIVVGGKGWFFVNGDYVATLTLEESADKGDVAAVTGTIIGYQKENGTTLVQDFTVKELIREYGPRDGSLLQEEGSISVHTASVSLDDFVTEAEFVNPYSKSDGSWSYGFMIKFKRSNAFEAIFVRSDQKWYHYLREGTVESSQVLDSGSLPYFGTSRIDTDIRGSNTLLIMAFGSQGWLFVNNAFVSALEFVPEVGDIMAMSGYFSDDEKSGTITRFEDFTIWAP